MGNITDKFVSSFSELYLKPSTSGLTSSSTETDIRNWFNLETAEQSTFTVGGTPASGTASDTITITGTAGSDVDTTELTVDTSSNTATTIATKLAAVMKSSGFAATATALAGVVTYTTAPGVGTITMDASFDTSTTTVSKGAVSTAYASGATKVPLVGEIGSLSNEATIIDVPVFGEKYKGKLRGQLDGGQIDASLFWAPRNNVHQDIREISESGKPVSVGIKWITDLNGGDTEYAVFDGYIASFGIDTTFDDVAKASVTFPVDGQIYFADAA